MKHFLLLLALLNFTSAHAQKTTDTLQLRLASPESFADINWGTVKQGERLMYYFKLKNDLPQEVTLHKIMTGDGGCYVDSIGKGLKWELPIKPGATVTFQVQQMTEGKLGAISKTILFMLSDEKGELPSRQFYLCGKIEQP